MSPLHLNGNLLVAIDVETTGLSEGFHEIVQLAIVPVGADLRPHASFEPFVSYLRPRFPDRAHPQAMATNGLSIDWLLSTAPESASVAAHLDDYIYSLHLPTGKGLVPLAHNWAFESGFLKAWLGIEHMQAAFTRRARDSMIYAASLMDRAEIAGQPPPFPGFSLKELTEFFGIKNETAHEALSDVYATIELYRHLLEWDLAQRVVQVPIPFPMQPLMIPPWTTDSWQIRPWVVNPEPIDYTPQIWCCTP